MSVLIFGSKISNFSNMPKIKLVCALLVDPGLLSSSYDPKGDAKKAGGNSVKSRY